MGNKYKLLPQLLPLFPKSIGIFYDLFCGGLTVSLNAKADRLVCNDIQTPIISIYREIQNMGARAFVDRCKACISEYKLDNKNEEAYLLLRNTYNIDKSPVHLMLLICHSFNNMARFNSKGEFNMPFGKNRTVFSQSQINGIYAISLICSKSIFFNYSYELIEIDGDSSFVYIDPPYFASEACYNKDWSLQSEIALLEYMDILNSRGIRFGLSNAITNNGNENLYLKQWISERPWLSIYDIDVDYGKCYQRKGGHTKEVYVCNYKAMAVRPKKF